jgi:outer membrane immunogenic protein
MRRFSGWALASFISLGLTGFGAASAADLPMYKKAPPPPISPVYNWSGWYAGVDGGGGWAQNRSIIVNETQAGLPFISGTWPGFGSVGSRNASGGFGGGQIGYNWQADHWVFGVEADIQGANIRSSRSVTLPYINAANTITLGVTEKLDWFGTVRGRIGYAWDRFLLYATGGLAYGQTRSSLAMTDTFGFTAFGTNNTTRVGYVVGAGGEYAFNPNWSAKLEYQYIDLGKGTINTPEFIGGLASAFAVNNTTRYDYHTVRIGLNYKWNAPVVAKY